MLFAGCDDSIKIYLEVHFCKVDVEYDTDVL